MAVYSNDDHKFYKGGFSIKEEALNSNGKIDCPTELKDLTLLKKMKDEMVNSYSYNQSRERGLHKIKVQHN